MYRMVPLVGEIQRKLSDATRALARIPMTDAIKTALEEAETAIDKAQGKLLVLERECRVKEPT